MGIWELVTVSLIIVFYVCIITLVVYVIRLARRLVLAVEKIADKIDSHPKM